jgi:dTDP-4-dehydrorhamnose reductase
MNKKILVIGKGFLGSHLERKLKELHMEVFTTGFNTYDNVDFRLDVLNEESIINCIEKLKPNFIINCSANVNIDLLEKNPDIAFSINAEGVKNIAKVSKKYNIRLIHISTDNVFDGKKGSYTEKDITNPINVYGKSKLLGEKFVKENLDNYVIVRTNIFGIDVNNRDFISNIVKNLKNQIPMTGFDDIIYTPLEVSNLSELISEITVTDYCGIIHLSSNTSISKFQFILEVADVFNLDKNLIKKGTSEDVQFIAKRPKNISLSNNKASNFLKTPIIPLKDSLEKLRMEF